MLLVLVGGCAAPAASGPPGPPEVVCSGVPQPKCDEAVASAHRSLPSTPLRRIEVVCVSGTCTPESGAMDTVVTTADGSTLRSSTISWAEPAQGGADTPPPVPAPGIGDPPAPDTGPGILPVAPQCQGIPLEPCRLMAETAFGEWPTEGVTTIVVQCGPDPCTPTGGAGETTIIYEDGTTRASTWEYAG